jgi:iron(III) transport system substrate-binding protein
VNYRSPSSLVSAVALSLLTAACAPTGPASRAAGVPDPAVDAWLKGAELGPYRKPADDWAAIEAAARAEGGVTVYSLSSRINDVAKTFQERYGIPVQAFDIGQAELVEKLTREQEAGVYNVDVVFAGDAPILINEILPRGHVVNFVPSDLADKLPAASREPLMRHHYGSKVLMYNAEAYPDGPGIDTVWDLTRPEWKGRLTMKDPLKSPENLNFLATVAERGDEMAALYEREFGMKLVTSEKSAGYEWLKRLIANNPALTSGDDETAKAIGERGRPSPPVGLIGQSKLRLNKDQNLALAVVQGMRPAGGVMYPAFVCVANRAPHPNAAKLLVRWMMGDEAGGQGFKPYYLEGDYPARTDVPLPPGLAPAAETGIVEIDSTWLYENGLAVRDFWIANGGTTRN